MEKLKADIVVIGTGGAGMAAAITAADGGAKVIVFEKRPFPGGNSNTPMGLGAVEEKMRDQAFLTHMELYHFRPNAALVRAFINEQEGTIEWMKQQRVDNLIEMGTGMRFPENAFTYFPKRYQVGSNFYFLKPRGRGHGGAPMIKTFVERAKEKGVEIHLATPVKKILKDGDLISGVIAEDKSGESIEVSAKAVVIATAGYGDDKEMVKKYDGFEVGHSQEGNKGDLFMLMPDARMTGDGIKMAWEVGAAHGSMGFQLVYAVPGPGILGSMPWINLNQIRLIQGQPYLWINQLGERFINEESAKYVLMANAIAGQKNKCAYLIFDGMTKKHLEEEGADYIHPVFSDQKAIDLDGQVKKCLELGNKNVFMADSLEELANQMDVKPDVLQETVNEYNQLCEKGHDDQFAKNPAYLRPVKEPKFYAFRNALYTYGTMGGIKINGKTEVLNKELEVIPGLYAAGDCTTGELYGDPPFAGLATITFALNTGRIAGKNVIKYIGK